jgi:GNAT superfamily N-acetyltransferase
MMSRVRLAREDEVPLLPGIEAAAFALYAPYADALGFSADETPHPTALDVLRAAQQAGRLWVAVDAGNAPVGFALVREIDGAAHLEELDVLPAHGHQGLGSALLDAVCAWAAAQHYPAVTLATFRDVPWNGPFYARRGFRVVPAPEQTAGFRRLVDDERSRGLRTDLRVIMRRDC